MPRLRLFSRLGEFSVSRWINHCYTPPLFSFRGLVNLYRISQILLFIAAILLADFACANSDIPTNPYGNAWNCRSFQGSWVCDAKPDGRPGVYSQNLNDEQKQSAISRALGWIPNNSDTVDPSVCGGYYYEPNYPDLSSEKPLSDSVSKVFSNQKKYTLGGNVYLNGNVEIIQPGRRMYADQVTLYPNPKDPNKPERIFAKGYVRMRQPGQMAIGKTLKANLYTNKATMTDAYYLMRVKADWSGEDNVEASENFTGYAHGHAEQVDQLSKTKYVFHHATYTTAPPGDNSWRLHATKIILDKISGRGLAENSVLHIQGVPVFYWPYFSFPLTNKRQTGFLYGTLSSASNNGFTFTAPYYLNIAPNYDDTVTPIFMLKRGVMLDNNFRFLTPSTNGTFHATLLPEDRLTNTDRWAVNYLQNISLGSDWTGNINYNDVSDKNYFNDFDNNDGQTAQQTYVTQSVGVNYQNTNWQFDGMMRNYKIIDQSLSTGNRPYNALPQLDLNAQYPNFWGPLQFSMGNQFINFQKNKSVTDTNSPIEAQRVNISPTLSLPLSASYGFFIPQTTFDNTDYQLQNTVVNNLPDQTITRSLPISSINTGLYFDRVFSAFGEQYTQTIEPRLYYLYVPYRNQNAIPSFDSSVIQFNYGQLFSTNRFNGIDRIGDANRLSYALSTQVDNDSGAELFDAAIGQAYSFQNERVSLCGSAGCIVSENPRYNKHTSDVAGQMNVALTPALRLHYDFTLSPDNRVFDTQNYNLQYLPDSAHIYNIGFSSNRTDYSLINNEQLLAGVKPPMLAQLNTSFLWKLTPLWRVIGQWDYSTNQRKTIEMMAGFEYSPCSWAVRLLWNQYLNNNNVNDPNNLDGSKTSSFVVQFQLKGLGNLGSSKIQYLAAEIPGYNPATSGF